MATHSSVLAWRIPGTGSLLGCRLWGRTESDTTERLSSSSSSSQKGVEGFSLGDPGEFKNNWCFFSQWEELIFVDHLLGTEWKRKSCPTLCNPVDYTVHGILQAKVLEWISCPFSRGSSQIRDQTQISHIAGRLFTSWATREAQKYWSG